MPRGSRAVPVTDTQCADARQASSRATMTALQKDTAEALGW